MGRRKVRHHKPKQFYEEMLKKYFNEHGEEVLAHTAKELGFNSFQELRDFEFSGYYGGFGLDCGWVLMSPKNREMAHEWELDNGKYSVDIFVHPTYNTQSTTIMKVEAKKAMEDLGLTNEFYLYTRLD